MKHVITPQKFMTSAQKADVTARTFTLDVTASLLNFFTYCIATGQLGYIPPGGYFIKKGILSFDTAYVDAAWPNIMTAGADLVRFRANSNTNAPFISITNGTATGSGFEGWLGGSLGGITFEDASGVVAANAHGLNLRGLLGTRFGYMRGEGLRADLVHIERKLFGGTNPDPYNVAACTFQATDANSCEGFALNNDNYLGLTLCRFGFVRAANCLNSNGGMFRGFGSANTVKFAAVGSCKGWFLDDGVTNTGGTSNRFTVEKAEVDNVEFGIRVTFGYQHKIKGIKINHRYQSTPNAAANYFPRVALSLGGDPAASILDSEFQLYHHIVAGGAVGDLGTFVDCNNTQIGNAQIDQVVQNDPGFAITNANYFTNVNNNSQLAFKRQGQVINDTIIHPGAYLRGTSGAAMTIGSNPITSGAIGTPTFTVTATAHGLVANQIAVIQGATSVDGIPAAQINRGHCVTSITDANNFVCTVEANCAAGGVSGGGASVTARRDQAFLNIAGFGGPRCKVAYATEVYDRAGNSSPTSYEYTVPYTGPYKMVGQFSIYGLSAGTQVRAAFIQNVHTSPNFIAVTSYRCQGVNRETIHCSAVASLAAGSKVSFQADQGSAAAMAPDIIGSEDCSWSIEPIGV